MMVLAGPYPDKIDTAHMREIIHWNLNCLIRIPSRLKISTWTSASIGSVLMKMTSLVGFGNILKGVGTISSTLSGSLILSTPELDETDLPSIYPTFVDGKFIDTNVSCTGVLTLLQLTPVLVVFNMVRLPTM